MLTCTVCSERFRVPWSSTMREEDAVCPACFEANFAGDALRQEPYAPTLSLTPRQVEAMRQVAQRWHEEHRNEAQGSRNEGGRRDSAPLVPRSSFLAPSQEDGHA